MFQGDFAANRASRAKRATPYISDVYARAYTRSRAHTSLIQNHALFALFAPTIIQAPLSTRPDGRADRARMAVGRAM